MITKDLTGQRFGKLIVIEKDKTTKKNYWITQCECGKKKSVFRGHLTAGRIDHCGCSRTEKIRRSLKTHGESNTHLFKIWIGMKTRCTNKNCQAYKDYGGRGIQICHEWMTKFENFRDWSLSHGYSNKLSIDRINSNGNYEPSNCRWTTMKEQCANRRNNHFIIYKGQALTISQWAEKLNFSPWIIVNRLKYGWEPERILTTPVKTAKTKADTAVADKRI